MGIILLDVTLSSYHFHFSSISFWCPLGTIIGIVMLTTSHCIHSSYTIQPIYYTMLQSLTWVEVAQQLNRSFNRFLWNNLHLGLHLYPGWEPRKFERLLLQDEGRVIPTVYGSGGTSACHSIYYPFH